MRIRVQLKQIASYSKGTQINGDKLIENGVYDYLNGGIAPSGKWNEFNTPGDTVTISEGGNSCGFVNYMRNPFWCGAHCYYLFDTLQNSEYLYYTLKSQQERLMGIRTGACMPNIKKADLGGFELTYDTDEQKQEYVVSVLKRVESIIQARQQQLDELDNLVKARFVEMFGDPVSNAKAWQMRPLKETCALMTGNTPSRAVKEYYGSYIEWIKSDNIANSSLYLTAAAESLSEKGAEVGRVVHPGTILMTCIAGSLNTIGNVAIVDRDVAFNQQINAIIPHQYDTLFLCYLLKLLKPKLHEAASSALKCILNKGNLEAFTAIVPDMALQKEFSSFVAQSDKSKLAVKQSLEKLETLKKSLMQQYFG